ncbi:glycoside hydrolase [Pukyongia salina]|uniref:Glycoside hydrolase n=1 Tax=Pukyongia salina TaxID=2094025 RepID=A0A2S0HY88_9FLAO|nr:trehalase family glycosidase [Pukyongia salina]AVI51524.1 glycoside hydrolase [Pukyongia salina]
MTSLLEDASQVLHNNWKDSFTIPCEGLYPFQWNWDSGFIAIGWAHLDMERAKREVLSLLKGQWKNGFIPHIVFHNEAETYYPGPEVHAAYLSDQSPKTKTSGITQPPVLGFVLEEIYNIAKDKEDILHFIDEVFDAVYLNHHYFYTHRDPANEGLVYICHNWEAGTDNTPVWDFIWETFEVPNYELDRKDTKLIDASHRPTNKEYQYYIHLIELFKQWKYDDVLIAGGSPFLIQDPLFNSMLIASNESIIRLGKLLNRTEKVGQLSRWQTRAKERMNTKLFDDQLNAYVYYDLRNERKLSHVSSSSFAPLMAGIPTKEQADRIVRHFQGGRFSGAKHENFLCASFDPGSEFFNSKKYWRGPIWINLNWIIYRGLRRYGYDEIADIIRKDTLYLMEKYGFYEYFEPSKEVNKSLDKGYGGNNFSWSAALTIDLLTNKI